MKPAKKKSESIRKKNDKTKKLWGGRFETGASSIAEEISESISFDKTLFEVDIEASIAHAKGLAKAKIITASELKAIEGGLIEIRKEILSGAFSFRIELEDIHMHIESRLIELIGEAGRRLHTARSRNDQVAVDTHLFLRKKIQEQSSLLVELLETLLQIAEKNQTELWAGYTHLQIAQPVTLSHYLLAHFWAFFRDQQLLHFVYASTAQSPLGSAAMGGPNYELDRHFTAALLGFEQPYPNSMDAVANRDYQLNYHFFATRFFSHISRICEDLIIYSTAEFQYVRMGDAVTTGSSIMPQKKNPDIAELLRGKSGRVNGNLQALITNLKGLPLTYNRDLQEDKVYLFDSIKQVDLGLKGLREILLNTHFETTRVSENLKQSFALATDVADFLVREKNIPFRTAHEIAGHSVKYCEKKKITLDQLTASDWALIAGQDLNWPKDFFSSEKSVLRRKSYGSTHPERVAEQLKLARTELKKYSFPLK